MSGWSYFFTDGIVSIDFRYYKSQTGFDHYQPGRYDHLYAFPLYLRNHRVPKVYQASAVLYHCGSAFSYLFASIRLGLLAWYPLTRLPIISRGSGFRLEMLLFSVALGDKIRIYKQTKETAEKNLSAILQTNEGLLRIRIKCSGQKY